MPDPPLAAEESPYLTGEATWPPRALGGPMRLITRADLDGLTCAVLLSRVEQIDEVSFAHPKDVQDGKVDIGPNDILANLPRDPRAGKTFDHHASQSDTWTDGASGAFKADAASAARVIASAYPKADFSAYEDLLHQTDRLDSAQLDPADVTDPKGWILIGYTLDPRTGMARYRDYFALLGVGQGAPRRPRDDSQRSAGRRARRDPSGARARVYAPPQRGQQAGRQRRDYRRA